VATSRCDIVHGLDIYFGMRVWRDDPRHNCLLLGRLDVEFLWACIFVPGLNRTDWHVIQIVEVENYYLAIVRQEGRYWINSPSGPVVALMGVVDPVLNFLFRQRQGGQ
jgi:hypothetical protein